MLDMPEFGQKDQHVFRVQEGRVLLKGVSGQYSFLGVSCFTHTRIVFPCVHVTINRNFVLYTCIFRAVCANKIHVFHLEVPSLVPGPLSCGFEKPGRCDDNTVLQPTNVVRVEVFLSARKAYTSEDLPPAIPAAPDFVPGNVIARAFWIVANSTYARQVRIYLYCR